MRGVEASISGARTLVDTLGTLLGRAFPARLPRMFPIAYKVALAFTLIIGLGMGILGWVLATDQAALLERQMIEASQTVVQQLAQVAKEPVLADDTLTLTLIVNHVSAQRGLVAVAIYSDEMKPITHAGLVPDAAVVADQATTKGMFRYSKTGTDDGDPVTVTASLRPMTVDGVTVGYALVGFDRALVEAAKHQTLRTVGVATLLLILLGASASILLGNRLTRPIRQIIQVSRAISAGNYAVRFTTPRNDELGELMAAMNAMTDGLAEKEHVEQTFSRYVAPQVARAVLRDTAQAPAAGRKVLASVVFADMVGFTALADSLPAAEVNTLVNEYFGYIAPLVGACYGHVDKYIGDCVMAVFGAPDSDPRHAQHAVECATLLQYLVDTLNHRRTARGQVAVQFHIGINSGAMLAGSIGTADRLEYTVMGTEVNVASRLAASAKAGQILLGEATYQAIPKTGPIQCQEEGHLAVRGAAQPVQTYAVVLDRAKHQDMITSRIGQLLTHLDAVA